MALLNLQTWGSGFLWCFQWVNLAFYYVFNLVLCLHTYHLKNKITIHAMCSNVNVLQLWKFEIWLQVYIHFCTWQYQFTNQTTETNLYFKTTFQLRFVNWPHISVIIGSRGKTLKNWARFDSCVSVRRIYEYFSYFLVWCRPTVLSRPYMHVYDAVLVCYGQTSRFIIVGFTFLPHLKPCRICFLCSTSGNNRFPTFCSSPPQELEGATKRETKLQHLAKFYHFHKNLQFCNK